MTKVVLVNEMMSDVELDRIAGGNRNELALDTKLFKALGYMDKEYTARDINNDNLATIQARVTDLWSKLGFTMKYNDFDANSYSGRNANNRNQAIAAAIYQAGRAGEIAPAQFYA